MGIFLSTVFGLFLAVQTGWCSAGINPDGSLNRETITKFYMNGDFQDVIDALEEFRKHNPSPSREDQIFIYKHLSVVYASNPETKDKAESYMYQLLKLVPTIDLIDMYISDNIESIFLRVKERYQRMEKQREPSDQSRAASPGPEARAGAGEERKSGKDTKNRKWIWWAAGGTAVVGVVTVFLLASGGEESGDINTISNYE
jgi:hypothetical protein